MDDFVLANDIINNNKSNIKIDIFHDTSFIYKTTNEKINLLKSYFEGKEKITCVTSSGDQILNSILWGNKKILSFDISVFPRYYLDLKIAALKNLTREEFIDFFFIIDYHKDEYYDDLYDKLKNSLNEESKYFWDNILNFNDWSEINNSTLFSSQTYMLSSIIKFNDYLKEENYDKLKNILDNVNINNIVVDIKDLVKYINEKQDLIYLSSIIYYISNYSDTLESLKDKIEEDGMILSYLYGNGTYDKGKVLKLDPYNDSILKINKND